MAQIDLPVQTRSRQKSRANRRARRAGQLPAVVYGEDKAPEPIVIDSHEFTKMLSHMGSSTIFNLKDNGSLLAQTLVRDVQVDPVTEAPVHVDFLRIRADHPVTVQVSVHGVGGVPIGVRQGGVMEQPHRDVEIRCLPLEVPSAFEVDISGMKMGDSLHVADLKLGENMEMLTPGDTPLFTVVAPRTATAAEEEGEEVSAAGAEMGEAEEGEGAEGEGEGE